MLGPIAAFLFLEQTDLGLNDGLHANDLIIGKVVGTFDGDGEATGLLNPLAVEITMGGHV
jgi:hypothetical protein